MIKTILSDSFDFGIPAVSLVDAWSGGVDSGWMKKRAVVLTKEISDIRPERGFQFLHLISLGSMESYGANRNGDGFNEKRGSVDVPFPKKGSPGVLELAGGLIEYHPTFAKQAKVYKHHKNDDPALSIGEVAAEAYNREMKRGELVIKVPENDEWLPHLTKLAAGESIPFSMSCRVPEDACSLCGNWAKHRGEYCDHLKYHMTEVIKSGHQVFAINDRPIFFDISRVFKPADRIAWSLRKVASSDNFGGAELAERLGVKIPPKFFEEFDPKMAAKLATAKKLAEIEKEVDSVAQGCDTNRMRSLLAGCPTGRLPADAMRALKDAKLGSALRGLSDAKICLSLEDFIQLVEEGKNPSSILTPELSGLKSLMPRLFGGLLAGGEAEECAADGSYDPPNTAVPQRLKEVLGSVSDAFSMDEDPVRSRMRIVIIRGEVPRMPETKSAAAPAPKSHLLTEYARYQLSFARSAGEDEMIPRLMVLRNRVGS